MYAEYGKALTAMREGRVLIDCSPLRGYSSATTVRLARAMGYDPD